MDNTSDVSSLECKVSYEIAREKIAFKYKDGYPPSPPLPHLPPLPHPPMNISFLTAILFTRRYL